jgi:predicted AAA+ superfamily ATPase
MRREIEARLIEWKDKSNRKPILIYGARQVGKTWLMKTIAKNHFTDYIYINFEKETEYKAIFESSLVPDKIIKSIEILSGKKNNNR